MAVSSKALFASLLIMLLPVMAVSSAETMLPVYTGWAAVRGPAPDYKWFTVFAYYKMPLSQYIADGPGGMKLWDTAIKVFTGDGTLTCKLDVARITSIESIPARRADECSDYVLVRPVGDSFRLYGLTSAGKLKELLSFSVKNPELVSVMELPGTQTRGIAFPESDLVGSLKLDGKWYPLQSADLHKQSSSPNRYMVIDPAMCQRGVSAAVSYFELKPVRQESD
jgi:hypothetical protein